MSIRTTRERLEFISSRFERGLSDALLQAFALIKKEVTLKKVEQALLTGGISRALALLTNMEKVITVAVREKLVDAAIQGGRIMPSLLPKNAVAPTFSFNVLDPRTVLELNNHSVNLVKEISHATRQAVVQNIEAGLVAGNNPIKIARGFRNTIGLTRTQEQAVRNYEAGIRAGDQSALNYALRDKRFDNTVKRVIENRTVIPEAKIVKMVDRFRARNIKYRADMIGRTESLRAVSMGEYNSLLQAQENDELTVELRRFWSAAMDERTRFSHAGMPEINKKGVRIDEPFRSAKGNLLRFPRDPSAPPGEVICCRCVIRYEVV